MGGGVRKQILRASGQSRDAPFNHGFAWHRCQMQVGLWQYGCVLFFKWRASSLILMYTFHIIIVGLMAEFLQNLRSTPLVVARLWWYRVVISVNWVGLQPDEVTQNIQISACQALRVHSNVWAQIDVQCILYILVHIYHSTYISIKISYSLILRKPAGRLGVVSPCERSENKEGVWGRGVVDTGAFFGRNRRCLGCRFWVSGSRLYH